jgi:hypothetical protein
MDAEEIADLLEYSGEVLNDQQSGFGMLINMRGLKPLPKKALKGLHQAQWLYKNKGMVRSAVVVSNAVLKTHLMQLAKQAGIYDWERYIDASTDQNWEQTAEDWIEQAIDPDMDPIVC